MTRLEKLIQTRCLRQGGRSGERFREKSDSNEENLSTKQTFESQETRFQGKDVYQERQKDSERQEKEGQKETDSLETMKNTLKKGYQFRRVYRTGKAFKGKTFRAVFRRNTLGCIRLGFSLSSKSGKAVSRNLMKRRIRSLAPGIKRGVDVVILPAGKLDGLRWKAVRADFERLVKVISETLGDGDG